MANLDYKSLSKIECEYIFEEMDFKLSPYWHQYFSMVFAESRNRVGFFHDVGTGKTPLALMTMKNIWHCNKILTCCPSSAYSAWERDTPAFTNYSIDFAVGTKREREKIFTSKSLNMVTINYEGLKSVFAKRKLTLNKKTGKIVNKWVIDLNKIHKYGFDGLILDEVHRCKTYNSLQSEICYELSKLVSYTIGMTGTPIDHSLLELFNIMKVIDHGVSLGTNFYGYLLKYFHKSVFEWEINKGAEPKILNRAEQSVIRFEDTECCDMPEVTDTVIECQATSEFLKLQNILIRTGKFIHKGIAISANGNPSAIGMLCKELASGFFYETISDTKKKIIHHLTSNPKAEAVVDKLNGTHKKLIMFYHWQGELEAMQRAFKKAKIKYSAVFGGQSHDARKKAIKDFQTDLTYRVLIAQDICSKEGFDGTVTDMVGFFSPIGSPLIRKQCIGRVRRNVQISPRCYVMDFTLKYSADARMIKNRGPRFSFVKSMLEYMREYGR